MIICDRCIAVEKKVTRATLHSLTFSNPHASTESAKLIAHKRVDLCSNCASWIGIRLEEVIERNTTPTPELMNGPSSNPTPSP